MDRKMIAVRFRSNCAAIFVKIAKRSLRDRRANLQHFRSVVEQSKSDVVAYSQ
jgi:hypothetical protein